MQPIAGQARSHSYRDYPCGSGLDPRLQATRAHPPTSRAITMVRSSPSTTSRTTAYPNRA